MTSTTPQLHCHRCDVNCINDEGASPTFVASALSRLRVLQVTTLPAFLSFIPDIECPVTPPKHARQASRQVQGRCQRIAVSGTRRLGDLPRNCNAGANICLSLLNKIVTRQRLLLRSMTMIFAVVSLQTHHRKVVQILLECKAQVCESICVLNFICTISFLHQPYY